MNMNEIYTTHTITHLTQYLLLFTETHLIVLDANELMFILLTIPQIDVVIDPNENN